MTNDERIALNNKCAELYCVKPYTGLMPIDEKANKLPHLKTDGWLIDDWSRLMPLAVEHDIEPTYNCDDTYAADGRGTLEREYYKDHPTKEQAVQTAIVKALIAKKESEQYEK